MASQEKIIKLNKIWYSLVACEHHKERDVHFYIIIDYHYGDRVTYTVEHKGYINHHYQETEWDSYEECQVELIKLLKYSILEELNWYLEHYGDTEWDQHTKYNKEQLEDIKRKVLDTLPD